MSSRIIDTIRKHPFYVILLVGFTVRLAFLLFYISGSDWNQLMVDSLFHDRWAVSIASGNVIGTEPFFRAPFYIYVLGAIYAFFGHSLLAARIFGIIIGLLSVFITYRLARKLFSPGAAFIAGLLHALYPIAIYFESELLVESLFTFLVELSVLWLFSAIDNRRPRRFFLPGLIFGLAVITRPVILPLFPLYILFAIIRIRKPKEALICSALLFMGVVAAIAPVTVRNALVGDDYVMVASSGGINFFIGNNPHADGLSASMPEPLGPNWQLRDVRYIAENETGRKLKDSQVSDFWYRKGLDWIKSNKGEFLKLYIKRLYFCINNFEISNNRNLPLFFRGNPVLNLIPINFALIFSLAIVFALWFRRPVGRDSVLFLIIFVVAYFLLISLFFINARFRLPMIPCLIIFAAAAVAELIDRIRTNHWLKVDTGIGLLAGLGAFLFSLANLYHVDRGNIDSGLYNRANYLYAQNDFTGAISLYHAVLEEDPRYPEVNLNLGAAFFRRGRGDSAEYYFKKEIENYPQRARAYCNLASLYQLRGLLPEAAALADRAIAAKPYWLDGYLVKIRILRDMSDSTGLVRLIAEAAGKSITRPRYYLEIGLTFLQWKQYEQAENYFNQAYRAPEVGIETDDEAFAYQDGRTPDAGRVRAEAAFRLGYLYGLANRLDSSIAMSSRAIALDSNLAEAYINLVNAYIIRGDMTRARDLQALAQVRFPHNELINALSRRIK